MALAYSHACLIHNARAGRGQHKRQRQVRQVIHELQQSGLKVSQLETRRAGDGEALARQAVQEGADLIIACGGDGTINEVACGMIHSAIPMAILPAGTANVLARELGLPLDIEAAGRCILSSVPRRLPMGRAGTRPFLLMTGVGFDAYVVSKVSPYWKRWFGMGTYVFEAIRQSLLRSPARFVAFDGSCTHQLTFACVAKTRHYGPIQIVPEANLFREEFFVYGFHSQNRFRYFLYALAVLTGRAGMLPDISRFPTRHLQFTPENGSGETIFLQTDGELAGSIPCSITVIPDALTLLVPAQFRYPDDPRIEP